MADGDFPAGATHATVTADEPDRADRLFDALNTLSEKLDSAESKPDRNLRGILTSEGQSKILHHALTAICAVVLAKFGGLGAEQATQVVTDSAAQIGIPAGAVAAVVGLFQWLRKDA